MKTHSFMRLARIVLKNIHFHSIVFVLKLKTMFLFPTTVKEDVSCVTDKESCRFKHYEINKRMNIYLMLCQKQAMHGKQK